MDKITGVRRRDSIWSPSLLSPHFPLSSGVLAHILPINYLLRHHRQRVMTTRRRVSTPPSLPFPIHDSSILTPPPTFPLLRSKHTHFDRINTKKRIPRSPKEVRSRSDHPLPDRSSPICGVCDRHKNLITRRLPPICRSSPI